MVTTVDDAAPCLGELLRHSAAVTRLGGHHHGGGIHVFDATLRPRFREGRHEHPHACFSFMLAGSIGESFDGHSMYCERNALSFHPATMTHRSEMSAEGARAILIEICGEPEGDLAELVRARPDAFVVSQRRLRDLAVDISRVLHCEDPVRPILIESLALDFMARALRLLEERIPGRQPAPPAWLDDFASLIDARLDRRLTAADIAALLRVTPRQLTMALQRHRGTTLVSFVRNRRLQRAQELLQNTELPLVEVALAAGFADQSHLTRCFRAAFGVTPSRFRQADTQADNPF